MLAAATLVAIGLISYSAYLVNWPLIVLGRIALMRGLRTPESIARSSARRSSSPPSPSGSWSARSAAGGGRARLRPVYAAGLLATLATVGLGWAGAASGGLPALPRFPHPVGHGLRDLEPPHLLPVPDQSWQAWVQAACTRTAGKDGLVLLWGDIFAAQYVPGLMRHADRLPGNLLQYTAAGCRRPSASPRT